MKNKVNAEKKPLQFIGIASQMVGTILLFAFLGHELDKKMDIKKNYLTAASALFGVFVSLYLLFKQLPKE